MRKQYVHFILLTLFVVTVLTLGSCSNPLVDDNGSDIPLIRLDLPKFDATYLVEFVEQNGLTTQPNGSALDVLISGANAGNLYDERFKETGHFTVRAAGVLSLNLDPNILISSSKPAEFTISGENSNYVVLPRVVRQRVAGNQRLQMEVINVSGGRAAMSRGMAHDELTNNSPEATQVANLNGKTNGNGYNFIALYRATERGMFTCENPGNDYSNYGIYVLGEDMSIDPATSKMVEAGKFFVTVKKEANMVASELKITVNGPVGYVTSYGYKISVDGRSYTGTITGTLPFSSTVEQIYLKSTASKSATVQLVAATPYTLAQATQTVSDITSNATASFNTSVVASPSLRECSIELLAFCGTEKTVAYSLTRQFQFRKTNAPESTPWSEGELKSGKCKLYLDDKNRYTFRIAINEKWMNYDLTTNPAEISTIITEIEEVKKYILKESSATAYSIYVEVASDELCTL